MKKLVIALAVALAVMIAYSVYSISSGYPVRWAINLIILAVALIIISDIYTCWTALDNTDYIITNQRVLSIMKGEIKSQMALDDVDEMKIVTGKNGFDSLCIGRSACKISQHKLRYAGTFGINKNASETVTIHKPVFYNIEAAANAREAILAAKHP